MTHLKVSFRQVVQSPTKMLGASMNRESILHNPIAGCAQRFSVKL